MCGRSDPNSSYACPSSNKRTSSARLYLANYLTPYAFTSHRVAVLELLASQAAIPTGKCPPLLGPAANEYRLRSVIDTITAHMWSTTPGGSFGFFNQRLTESDGRKR
jgi:hypothetical protein